MSKCDLECESEKAFLQVKSDLNAILILFSTLFQSLKAKTCSVSNYERGKKNRKY